MPSLLMLLGIVGLVLGVAIASRRQVEPRLRLAAAGLAAVGLVLLAVDRWGGAESEVRRYEDAYRRQGTALGFGLGQYLKQTQAGRQLAILAADPHNPRERATIKGLKDGLDGALKIVAERTYQATGVDLTAGDPPFSPQLLADLKATGADIVVSFPGVQMRLGEYGAVDTAATQALWRAPEYRALQWVLPRPPDPWPEGMFEAGRVLVVVRDKLQPVTSTGFPKYLEIQGSPAELFDAWFEIVTMQPTE